MCTVLLPPGDNPIAVNKYINIKINIIGNEKKLIESKRIILNIRQGVKFFIYDLEIYYIPENKVFFTVAN